MAAVTMSMDRDCCRYAAAVQTNGYRVEMITPDNIKQLIIPYVQKWKERVGGGNLPHHIYYFRDGVSEGQYSHVLSQEVDEMKKAMLQHFGSETSRVSLLSLDVVYLTINRFNGPSLFAPSVTISDSSPGKVILNLVTATQTPFQVLWLRRTLLILTSMTSTSALTPPSKVPLVLFITTFSRTRQMFRSTTSKR